MSIDLDMDFSIFENFGINIRQFKRSVVTYLWWASIYAVICVVGYTTGRVVIPIIMTVVVDDDLRSQLSGAIMVYFVMCIIVRIVVGDIHYLRRIEVIMLYCTMVFIYRYYVVGVVGVDDECLRWIGTVLWFCAMFFIGYTVIPMILMFIIGCSMITMPVSSITTTIGNVLGSRRIIVTMVCCVMSFVIGYTIALAFINGGFVVFDEVLKLHWIVITLLYCCLAKAKYNVVLTSFMIYAITQHYGDMIAYFNATLVETRQLDNYMRI